MDCPGDLESRGNHFSHIDLKGKVEEGCTYVCWMLARYMAKSHDGMHRYVRVAKHQATNLQLHLGKQYGTGVICSRDTVAGHRPSPTKRIYAARVVRPRDLIIRMEMW
jgi:hypothetical protein